MSDISLSVQNVSKAFKGDAVLSNVSMSCTKGKIYGIIGRNGSGKSVLFKIICGFMHADSGSVSVCGKQVGKDIDFPDNIGVMIDSPGFLWYESGLSNLMYLAGIKNMIKKDDVKKTMRIVGLDPDNKKIVAKYSLGMKQRLNIAQAIMENPDILILDEPMNGLDDEGVKDMRSLFLKLKAEGKLMVITSHNKEDIEILCDEVYQIGHGVLKKI